VVGAIFPIGEEIVDFASYLHGLYAFTDAKIRYLSQNSKGLGDDFSQNSEVLEGEFSQNSRNFPRFEQSLPSGDWCMGGGRVQMCVFVEVKALYELFWCVGLFFVLHHQVAQVYAAWRGSKRLLLYASNLLMCGAGMQKRF
jgi:hypothetical protein